MEQDKRTVKKLQIYSPRQIPQINKPKQIHQYKNKCFSNQINICKFHKNCSKLNQYQNL